MTIFLDKIWYLLIYALALFPILPKGVESILMIVLFLVSVALYLTQKKNRIIQKREVFKIIFLSIIFITYVIGASYSENSKEALKFIIRTLPFLAFSLIFGLLYTDKFDNDKVKKLLFVYCISVLFGLLYTQISLRAFNNLDAWGYRQEFEKFTKVHGNYASLWIGFASLMLLDRFLKAKGKMYIYKILILSIVLIYFLYWQMEIGARVPLLATILLLTAMIVVKIKKKKASLIVIVSFFMLLFSIIAIKPEYTSRLKEVLTYDTSLPQGDYHIEQGKITNAQIRNGIYYCSAKLVKESWFIGLGIGDVNDRLQKCYKNQIDSNVYQVFKFNSHNQFLHFLLSSGVVGLILFIISILLPIYIAYKTKQQLFLMFGILILLSLFTENVLSRHDGIIFYSFFNSIFVFLGRDYKNI